MPDTEQLSRAQRRSGQLGGVLPMRPKMLPTKPLAHCIGTPGDPQQNHGLLALFPIVPKTEPNELNKIHIRVYGNRIYTRVGHIGHFRQLGTTTSGECHA